uniref:Uncharacterized protein n=1 Tax=Anguilla anguilla TaxID=7936 RepID=A0A0E9T8H3_ANGAN
MKFSFKLEGSYQCRNGERLCFGDRALCGQHWHLRVIEFCTAGEKTKKDTGASS